ncbi:MFS transporter [Streptomyces sp. S.PNR 29]|uniref:MFS transporter n=1 Tax=Streptomyces sp. S.PNR 29 TaxID=2973805 RepID=UPI0025AF2672|nr:MFS transporter [Streptomyces sp. S.PNR 29]MDN0198500.1 MFS transporter [Streptomyces sp. S.PNR 29]
MNPRLTLASSVAGAAVVALDGTVLTVAQPTLQRDLDASFGQVQWTSTGYLIAVASLLVFAGRLGDRYGHQRVFGIGMLGFGAASAGVGLAPDAGWVIALRIAQGVSGALLQPATLGMLRAAYPPDRLRLPIALRTSAIGLAAAAGPVAGGALVAGPGWRAVFLVNVVPALAFGVLALAVPGPRRAHRSPLDLPGALLLAVTLACLVHALVALPEPGWTAVAGPAAGAAFVRHERRTARPLVPEDIARSPAVGSALGILVAASAALSGTLFAGTFVLQDTLGLDPVQSALRSLPLALLMVLAAPCCAVLLRRAGARRTTVAAMAVLALGILVLSRASATPALCGGFALIGAGFGTVMVAATHVVVRQAPVASAGVAGGLQQTAMNVGPTLGVAAATTLMALGGAGAALLTLAAVAVAGATAGLALPGRRGVTIVGLPDEAGPSRVTAPR